jgi:hypothetical protein
MPMSSVRHRTLAALAALALPTAALAQAPTDSAALAGATLAWERGEYPLALRTMSRLLQSAGGERHRAAIALLTGER